MDPVNAKDLRNWKAFEEENNRTEIYCIDCAKLLKWCEDTQWLSFLYCPKCEGVLDVGVLCRVPKE